MSIRHAANEALNLKSGSTGLEQLQSLLDRSLPLPPFAETTGIIMTEAEHGRVVFEGVPSSRFYNPLGTVHGGWTSTLLDSALGCAVHSALAPGQSYTTVDMTVTFVRAIFEKTGTLRCEGKLVHLGRSIATSEAKVFDAAGKLIAHGTETCMIMQMPAA